MAFQINIEECLDCGACIAACPQQCIADSDLGHPIVNPDNCNDCNSCREVCPVDAMYVAPPGGGGSGGYPPEDPYPCKPPFPCARACPAAAISCSRGAGHTDSDKGPIINQSICNAHREIILLEDGYHACCEGENDSERWPCIAACNNDGKHGTGFPIWFEGTGVQQNGEPDVIQASIYTTEYCLGDCPSC